MWFKQSMLVASATITLGALVGCGAGGAGAANRPARSAFAPTELTSADGGPSAPSPSPSLAAPPPPPPASNASPPPADIDSAEQERADHKFNRAAGFIVLAVGIEAGVVTLGTFGMMLKAKSDRDAGCNDAKMCTQAGIDANSRLHDIGIVNSIALITAAVGVAGGLYLILTNPNPNTNPTHAKTSTMVGFGPGGAALRGTFE